MSVTRIVQAGFELIDDEAPYGRNLFSFSLLFFQSVSRIAVQTFQGLSSPRAAHRHNN